MAIRTIPLSRLEADLKKTLNDCADSGDTVVVEMPDQRLLAIQRLEPQEDDDLMDRLLASNPEFQALVANSKASRANHFPSCSMGNHDLFSYSGRQLEPLPRVPRRTGLWDARQFPCLSRPTGTFEEGGVDKRRRQIGVALYQLFVTKGAFKWLLPK